MPKIIVNCRYMKGGAQATALVEYMGKRPGVVFTEHDTYRLNPATEKQTELIAQLERTIPDLKTYFEYEDYAANQTVENASAVITAAMDYNLDVFSTKENLIEYMGKRPGSMGEQGALRPTSPRAERVGEHGLFNGDESVDIRAAMDEVAAHPGNIWTHVVSLRREDAERLGYNNQRVWRDLAVRQAEKIAEAMGIPYGQFRWYAAFHNEAHHPHLHMVAYSADAKSGYLTKKGIEKIKSGFAHEIFRQDFYQVYERKQLFGDDLTRYSRERMKALIGGINADSGAQPELERMLADLAAELRDYKGKKVYGFLKPKLKAKVDAIVRALAGDPRVAELYRGWCECQNEIIRTYKFDVDAPPLEKQPEFRGIHNAVIRAAAELAVPAAQQFIAAPEPGGDFPILQESEENINAPQERECAEKADARAPEAPQAVSLADFRYSEPGTSVYPPATPTVSDMATAAARLLRSLGRTVYNSYDNNHSRLFAKADRRLRQKQEQKRTAQGHRRDDHEQEQIQY